MDLQLRDKRAVVTGGSQGIGLAIAHALAAEGVDVVLAARDQRRAEAAAAAIAEASGRRALAVPTDTSDDRSVRALMATAVSELGGVDILVNNAANQRIGTGHRLSETTDEDFWADVDVKVVGYLRTARAAAPLMVAQEWGRIINVSGIGARQTLSITRTVRNVGVVALSKNLADELGPAGVNVTVVHPGLTRTESIAGRLADEAAAANVPLADWEREQASNSVGRLIDATEVAAVVAFLASPRSSAINGDVIEVGGGQPGVVHY